MHSVLDQSVGRHEKHLKEVVEVVESLPGDVVNQKSLQIRTHVVFEKGVHRATQLGTVLIVIACIQMATDEYGPIEECQRFDFHP